MKNRFLPLFLLPALAGLSVSLPADEADPAALSLEGLALVEKDSRGEIYADPDVDWSVYSQVLLQDATVAFRRNWQRDQNRGNPFKVDAKDVEEIKTGLAELFREVFTEELTVNGGYMMSTEPGESVLTIKPAIVDLDIAAPDTMTSGRTMQYTESEGRMTLKLELYDSVTGALLATGRDHRRAPDYGYLKWTTSVSNKAEARRMLEHWAKGLRTRLDEARSATPAADAS